MVLFFCVLASIQEVEGPETIKKSQLEERVAYVEDELQLCEEQVGQYMSACYFLEEERQAAQADLHLTLESEKYLQETKYLSYVNKVVPAVGTLGSFGSVLLFYACVPLLGIARSREEKEGRLKD